MEKKEMIRRTAALVLAVMMGLMQPMGAFAQGHIGIDVKFTKGMNDHEFTEDEALTEEEMDAVLYDLSSGYMTDISADEAAYEEASCEASEEDAFGELLADGEAMDEGMPLKFSLFSMLGDAYVPGDDDLTEVPEGTFRLYPVTDKEGSTYDFKGLIIGGDTTIDERFTGLKFSLNGGEEEEAATASEGMYPDSSTLSSARYAGGSDDWQRVYRASELSEDTLYAFAYEYTYETPAEEGGEDPEEASGSDGQYPEMISHEIDGTSESFLIYRLKDGDTLLKVSQWYGVSLDTLKEDNGIADEDKILASGDTLFIRGPKTDEPLTASGEVPDHGLMERIGDNPAAEYAYGAVDIGTGNLYLKSEEVHLDEYRGYDITRTYNSLGTGYKGLFGRGFSTEADMHIAQTEGGMLVNPGDGSEYILSAAGEGRWTGRNGWYTLTRTEDGYLLTDPQLERWTFDGYGLVTSYEQKNCPKAVYSYTDDHRLSGMTSPAGLSFTVTLNDDGNITDLNKPDGTQIQYSYESGYLKEMINENGYKTVFTYNADGLIEKMTDPLGNDTFTAGYDGKGRAVSFTDAEGNNALLNYAAGRTTFTDKNSDETAYELDSRMRPVKITYSDGKTKETSFDDLDRVTREKDRAGDETKYDFDSRGNLLKKTYKSVPVEENTYDGRNNILSSVDEGGKVTRYEYDEHDNNIKLISPDGKTCSFI